jgi:hypothetical protein
MKEKSIHEIRKKPSEILVHLKRVLNEIEKLIVEIQKKPNEFGYLESRLFWAIRGVDPHTSRCTKHNKKIRMNSFGEYVCLYCVDDIVGGVADEHVDDLWFDPKDKPQRKIGLKY